MWHVVVRSVVLSVLLAGVATSTAMARDMLYRGTGVVSKSGFLAPTPVNFVATVIMGVSSDGKLRIGYKTEFSDGSSGDKLALLLTEGSATEVNREAKASRGEAKLLIHSGTRQRADGFSGASGTWTETDDGFRVEFTREDRSKMEMVIDIQTSPTKIGGDMIPDVKITITVRDLPSPDVRDGITYDWKILSRLDFNALMRDDDTSTEALLEELFGNN